MDLDAVGTTWMSLTQQLGLELLGLVVTIDLLRETLKLVRGVHAEFGDVVVRGVVAAAFIAAIPTLSTGLARAVTAVSNAVNAGEVNSFEMALKGAMSEFTCSTGEQKASSGGVLDAVSHGLAAVEFAFSTPGIVVRIGAIFAVGVVVLKFFMMDVLWPIMFSVTVYLGVLSIPVTFMKEMGGLLQFAKQVLAIALWPIVFALMRGLMVASFPSLMARVAHGHQSWGCQILQAQSVGDAATSMLSSSGGMFKDILKFMAVCLGMGFMLLKTPAICAGIMGTGDPAQGLTGTLGRVVSMVATKGMAGKKG